jgi:hypothetical protein
MTFALVLLMLLGTAPGKAPGYTLVPQYDSYWGQWWEIRCDNGSTWMDTNSPTPTQATAVCNSMAGRWNEETFRASLGSTGRSMARYIVPAVAAADVPAINQWRCDSDHEIGNGTCVGVVLWACADKSRILMTAEDGKKWCHKPQTGVQP